MVLEGDDDEVIRDLPELDPDPEELELDDDDDPVPLEAEGEADRPQTRVQRLANERRELADKVTRLEAERQIFMEQMQRQQQSPQQPPQEELDPQTKWYRDMEAGLRNTEFRMRDELDKQKYGMKAERNTVYKKYEAEVEKTLSDLRRNGQDLPREDLLAYIIGKQGLQNSGKAKKDGEKRRAAAVTTTPGVRSTVTQPRSEPSLKERLLNVRL